MPFKILNEVDAPDHIARSREWENKIADKSLQKEHGALYNKQGKLVAAHEGGAHGVDFSTPELDVARGGTLIHNHPSGHSFSHNDLALAHSHHLTIRAVGTDGEGTVHTYQVKARHPSKSLSEKITREFPHEEQQAKLDLLSHKKGLSDEQVTRLSREATVDRVCKENDMTYTHTIKEKEKVLEIKKTVLYDLPSDSWIVCEMLDIDENRSVASIQDWGGYYKTLDLAVEYAQINELGVLPDTKYIQCKWNGFTQEFVNTPKGVFLPVMEGLETEEQRKWWFANLAAGEAGSISPKYLEKLNTKTGYAGKSTYGSKTPKSTGEESKKTEGLIVHDKSNPKQFLKDYLDKGGDQKKYYAWQKNNVVKDDAGKVVGYKPPEGDQLTEEAKTALSKGQPITVKDFAGNLSGVYYPKTGQYVEIGKTTGETNIHQLIPYQKTTPFENKDTSPLYQEYIKQGGDPTSTKYYKWKSDSANLVGNNEVGNIGYKPPSGEYTKEFADAVKSGDILPKTAFSSNLENNYVKAGGDEQKYQDWKNDEDNHILNSSGQVVGYKAPSGDYKVPESTKTGSLTPVHDANTNTSGVYNPTNKMYKESGQSAQEVISKDTLHPFSKSVDQQHYKDFVAAGGDPNKYSLWKSDSAIQDSNGNVVAYKLPNEDHMLKSGLGKSVTLTPPTSEPKTTTVATSSELPKEAIPYDPKNAKAGELFQSFKAAGGEPDKYYGWKNNNEIKDASGNVIGFHPPTGEHLHAPYEDYTPGKLTSAGLIPHDPRESDTSLPKEQSNVYKEYVNQGGDPNKYNQWKGDQLQVSSDAKVVGYKPPSFQYSKDAANIETAYQKAGGDMGQYRAWQLNKSDSELKDIGTGKTTLGKSDVPTEKDLVKINVDKYDATVKADALGLVHTDKSTGNLNPGQYKALTYYTGSGYDSLNKGLRTSSGDIAKLDKYDQEHVKNLDDVYSKLSMPNKETVYRGVYNSPNLKVGDTFTEHGYMSTSTNPTVATSFSHGSPSSAVFRINLEKGDPFIGVKPVGIAHENEVLGNRGTKLKVLKISTGTIGNDSTKHLIYDVVVEK